MTMAALVLALGGYTAPAVAGQPIEVDKSYNGKTVTVTEGTDVIIALPGDKSAGFSWRVEPLGGDVFTLNKEGEVTYAVDPDPNGQGGTFSATFSSGQPGTAEVTMKYSALDTFTLKVKVLPHPNVRVLTPKDNGKVINVKAGAMLKVALPIQGGVPYMWVPAAQGTTVIPYGSSTPVMTSVPGGRVVGPAGQAYHRFTTNGIGKTRVTLDKLFLGRRTSGGKVVKPIDTFSVTINVTP